MTVTQPYIDERQNEKYCVTTVTSDEHGRVAKTWRHRTINDAIRTFDDFVANGYRVAVTR